MSEEPSTLDKFLRYADQLEELMGARVRAAYAETCTCGAAVEIGVDVEARERRRLANHFIARHQHCPAPAAADINLEERTE